MRSIKNWLVRKMIEWKLRYVTFSYTQKVRNGAGVSKLMSYQITGRFMWSSSYSSDHFTQKVAIELVKTIKTSLEAENITLYMECYHKRVVEEGFGQMVNLVVPAWTKSSLLPTLEEFINS